MVQRDMGLLNVVQPPELGDGGGGWPMSQCSFRTASIRASSKVAGASEHSRRAWRVGELELIFVLSRSSVFAGLRLVLRAGQ